LNYLQHNAGINTIENVLISFCQMMFYLAFQYGQFQFSSGLAPQSGPFKALGSRGRSVKHGR
jgi:hypothetical protein